MRQAQKSGRSRGRGGRKGGGGGGGNNINRVYDSAGPEGKVRGTPQQIIDKYLTLARDAQTSGDRVTAENFLQHAEHYQRILISAMSEQEKSRREAAAQATDDDQDEQSPSSMDVADSPSNGGSQPRGNRKAQSEEIGGMATIDADPGPDSLVVAPEEMTNSQPRQEGNSRRSRRRPPRDDSAAAQQSGDQPTAEAAEG